MSRHFLYCIIGAKILVVWFGKMVVVQQFTEINCCMCKAENFVRESAIQFENANDVIMMSDEANFH